MRLLRNIPRVFLAIGTSVGYGFERLVRPRKRLDTQRHEMELVTSRTPLLLSRCSRDLRYTFVNRAYAEFLGRPREEILGRPIPEVIGNAAFVEILPHIERALRGEDLEFEHEVPYAGPGTHFIRAIYTPDRDARGDVTGWVSTITDVTESKRTEALTREAARRVREREEQVVSETVEVSHQLVLESRRKDEFLATLAHELRNPLAPVRTAAHVLGRVALEPETKRLVHMIERQVSHMARLLEDLLDVSRISRGEVNLSLEYVSFVDVAQAAMEITRGAIESRSHTLAVTWPRDPVVLHADRHRLIQVLGNLIGNAAKYTPPGGRIEFVAHVRDDVLEMRIRDNGVGIAPEQLARIFDLFARAPESQHESGLGIGLTLARKLVLLHHGVLEAQSDGPGRGSTFLVRLPTAVVPHAPEPRVEAENGAYSPA